MASATLMSSSSSSGGTADEGIKTGGKGGGGESECYALMAATSNGILQGDVPLHFALPLLIVQIAVVLLVTRSMAYLFKHIKQPRVLAEIIGGVLLGPTALGRNKEYMELVFPKQSMPLLETIATMGLMFFIFMVGLELDLQALGKTGRKAFLIAIAGIAAPFVASAALASLIRSTFSQGASLGPLILFVGTPLSISAFSVLVRIMAELRLLSTDIGKLAIPSAAVNDVTVWTLLAVGVAMSGPKHEPLIPLWVFLCGVGFGLIMFTLVRMFMTSIAHRAVKQGQGNDIYVCITLLCVLLAGFSTDALGVHPLLGPFLLGLVIPKENPAFPKMIIEKIEDFVTGLMLPLFFASSGLKTNLGSLHGVVSLGFLALFFATAAIGKITGTFVVARLTGLSTRRALILGFLMNTKGLAVLIVLNIGRDLKALTDETFAILVLTCLLTSFVTFPVVSALCKLPGGGIGGGDDEESLSSGAYYEGCNVETIEGGGKSKLAQLRVLACTDNDAQYPALVNLMEAARGLKKPASGRPSSLKLYTLRLIHLSDRPSALLNMLSTPSFSKNSKSKSPSSVLLFFPPSIPLSKVKVKPLPSISSANLEDSVHFDVYKLALAKRTSIIILPYYQDPSSDDGFSKAYLKVLEHNPPCSVAILVDNTSMGSSAAIHPSFFSYNVLVLFIGGADDREALSLASRMADHPGVSLKVIRIISKESETFNQSCNQADALTSNSFDLSEKNHDLSSSIMDVSQDKLLDNEAILRIKEKAVECSRLVYEEEHVMEGQTLVESIQGITKTSMSEFNLFIVGRRVSDSRAAWPCSQESSTFNNAAECSELGIVGDVLLAAESECHTCVLVVQQHSGKKVDELPSPSKSDSLP